MTQVEQIQTNKPEFNLWLSRQGYCNNDGVLVIPLREARATFLQQDIQNRKSDIERNLIQICYDLWEIYKTQLWTELGFDSFEQLLCSPEIDLSRSMGYSYKEVGRLLEEGVFTEAQAMEIGPSKLKALLPAIRENPNNIEELLDKASELNYLDLVDEVSGREVYYYKGHGPLSELIQELKRRPEFWEGDVSLNAKTY